MKTLIYAVMALFISLLPAAAQESYQIKPGDVLRIEVAEDPSLTRSVLVAPDGRIAVPLAGSLTVAGQSVDQVQAALTTQLASSFATAPNVTVALESVAAARATGGSRQITVYVIGQAKVPGKYTVPRGTTILQFLAEIGGFTDFAATNRIQIHRRDAQGNETVYVVNYRAVETGAATGITGTVAQGDVIVIPQRGLFE